MLLRKAETTTTPQAAATPSTARSPRSQCPTPTRTRATTTRSRRRWSRGRVRDLTQERSRTAGGRPPIGMPVITGTRRFSCGSLEVSRVRLRDAPRPSPQDDQPLRPRREESRSCNARSGVTINMCRNGASEGPLCLTSAEARVLPFLSTQLTIEEIAGRVGRRRSTVKTHVAHIYAKLGASKRTEAVERACELGLLRDPERSALLGHPGTEKPARVGRARPDRTVGNLP